MSRTNLPPPEQSCVICSKPCVLECIKCETCEKYIHPNCSKLPAYALVNWFTTRHKYKCELCVRTSMNGEDYDRKFAFVSHLLLIDAGEAIENEGGNNIDQEVSVCKQPLQVIINPASENGSEQECSDTEQPLLTASVDSNKSNPPVNQTLPSITNASNSKNTYNSVKNSDDNKKTNICKFYKTHSCKYGRSGKKCNYAHPKVCYKYKIFGRDTKRGCTSQSCTHYHPVICKHSEKDRLCLYLECPYLHLKGTRRYQPQPSITFTPTPTQADTNIPGGTYLSTTHSHTCRQLSTNQPTNQYQRNNKSQHFLFSDIQEMKAQLAQLMRLLPIQRDQNFSPQHQHHPVPLPNMAHPSLSLQRQY